MATFVTRVPSMSDDVRNKKKLPSKYKMNKIEEGWKSQI